MFNWLGSLFSLDSSDSTSSFESECPSVNPANGLPMVGCSVDIEGNPYGTDSSLGMDDSFSSFSDDSFSSFSDDSFSSFSDHSFSSFSDDSFSSFSDDSFSSFDSDF